MKNILNITVNDFIKKSSLGILFFLCIYPVRFAFFPFASTRVTIGAMGILLFLINSFSYNSKKILAIKREWLSIAISLMIILLIAIFVDLVNGTKETYFFKFPLSMIAIFGASYAVAKGVKSVYHEITFEIIARYIVITVVLQMIITILMFISPIIKESLLKLLAENYQAEVGIDIKALQWRIIGFGSQFFAAGIVNSFALILLAILIKHRDSKNEKTALLKVNFILVSVVGTILSRTTLVGILLSFAVFFYKSRIFILKRSTVKLIFIFAVLIVLFICFMPSSVHKKINTAARFGFEMFYNYFEKGELTTNSTNQLFEMYDVHPDNLKTLIIGDGYYKNPRDSSLYYMNTDVGYLRLIFYFGIIGSIAYFTYQITLLKTANKITEKLYPQFFFFIAILLLILNLKGMTEMTSLVSLFLFCEKEPKINISEL